MSARSLLRYSTNGRCLAIFHSLLLIMHLLLHLHQAVIVLLKLFVFRETLLVLHSDQVKGVYSGWEMATAQDSFIIRYERRIV